MVQSASTAVVVFRLSDTVVCVGTDFVAVRLYEGFEDPGVVTFSVHMRDLAGNTAIATATTDGSTVSFDNNFPTVEALNITSNNQFNTSYAKVGSTVQVRVTFSENVTRPDVFFSGAPADYVVPLTEDKRGTSHTST